ncbi:hypothetical protein JCM16303_003421 [Sporobolomyces ruberrimus]
MTGSKCTACGKPVSLESWIVVQCRLCQYVDLEVLWCDESCKKKSLKVHEEAKCAGPASRRIDINSEESYRHFCTPACRMEIVTPRLRIRPVELSDIPRVFKIKSDPLVSKMQLYGTVHSESQCSKQFVQGYVNDTIPALSTTLNRTRYVFGIEPRILPDGTRSVLPRKHTEAKHDLDEEGYVGNIAVEMTDKGTSGFFGSRGISSNRMRKGEVFRYPEREELKDKVEGTIFYELHPNFWRQGIVTEALKSIISFSFRTLNLSTIILDPQPFNAGSIALAEQNGFVKVGEKGSWVGTRQLVYKLEYDDWEKGRNKGRNKKRRKKGKGKDTVQGEATAGQDGVDDPEEAGLEENVAPVEEKRKCCRW